MRGERRIHESLALELKQPRYLKRVKRDKKDYRTSESRWRAL